MSVRSTSHRFVLLSSLVTIVCCGGKVDTPSQGNASASGSPNGGDGAPSSQSGAQNQTPSAPASQSPIPTDAPCSVAPGAPLLIYPGHPDAFAIDGSFIYVAEFAGMSRLPIGGGAPTPVVGAADIKRITSFAIGAGFVFYQTDDDTTAGSKPEKVAVSGDAFVGPTFDARSTSYAALAFDGLSVYSGQVFGNPAIVRRWPIDGSPEVDTMLPPGTWVQAIVAGPDGAYVALLEGGSNGVPTRGTIAKIPLEGGSAVVLAKDVGEPTSIAVDDKYIYYGATHGGLETGALYRISLDGSGVTSLSEPAPMALAVDSHSAFFLRNSLIYKVDKLAGGNAAKIGASQQFGGVLVNGGNVFWSGAVDGDGAQSGVWTACK